MAAQVSTISLLESINSILTKQSNNDAMTAIQKGQEQMVALMSQNVAAVQAQTALQLQEKNETGELKGIAGIIPGVIKSLKELKVSDVIRMSMLPLRKLALNLRSFVETLGEGKVTASAAWAGKALKETFAALATLVAFPTATLVIKMKTFPMKQIMKFFIGTDNVEKAKAKPGGLLGGLKSISDVMENHFNDKKLAQYKENIGNVKSIITNLAKIIVTTSLLGLIALPAMPLMLLGFAAIYEAVGLTVVLTSFINVVGSDASTKEKAESIFNVQKVILMSAGIVGVAALLGAAFVSKPITMLWALGGLGAIALVTITSVLLSKLISTAAKLTKESIIPVMTVLGFMALSGLIVSESVLLGKYISGEEGGSEGVPGVPRWKLGLMGFGSIAAVVTAAVGLSFLLNLSKPITMSGISGFLPIALIMIGAGFMVAGIVEMQRLVNSVGKEFASDAGWIETDANGKPIKKNAGMGAGWLVLLNGIASIGIVVAAAVGLGAGLSVAAPIAAIGAAAFIPVGLMMFGAIGLVNSIVNLKKAISESGTTKDLEQTVKDIPSLLKLFLKGEDGKSGLIAAIDDIEKSGIRKKSRILRTLMKPVADFCDILARFEIGDDGSIRVIRFDKDGKVTAGTKINIDLIGEQLGSGFSKFSTAILNGLMNASGEKDGEDSPKGVRRKIRLIRKVMEPVNMFVDILSRFESDGEKVNILDIDENGSVKGKRRIDIVKVAGALTSGFTTFAKEIFAGLEKASTIGAGRKIKLIGEIMDPITKFLDIINKTGISEDGTKLAAVEFDDKGNIKSTRNVDVKNIATVIGTGITDFSTIVFKALDDLHIGLVGGITLKERTEDINNIVTVVQSFVNGMNGIMKETSEADTFKSINSTICEAMKETLDMYGSNTNAKNLKKTLQYLDKTHAKYIDRVSTAMKNAKEPMKEYIDELKEVVDCYDKLQQRLGTNDAGDKAIILNVDKSSKSSETKTTTVEVNGSTEEGKNAIANALIEAFKDEEISGLLGGIIMGRVQEALDGMSMKSKDNKAMKDAKEFEFEIS